MSGRAEEIMRTDLLPIGSRREMFDVPEDVAYFNTASMSPLLLSVRRAGEAGLARRAEPWAISSSGWFADVERLREAVGRLLGATGDAISLVPATSYGLAVAARNLAAVQGDQVIVLGGEYPSNFYTWERFCSRTGAKLVVAERDDGESWTDSVLARINERTRVVAVPQVHWTNGAMLDLDAIASAGRDAGAALVIDASQSLGALPLDVSTLKPDFVVAVGYKWLLGPLGVGYMYVAEKYWEGEPIEENWINRSGSEDFSALVDYTDQYREGARRFDVGQRTNFGLVPMALAAIEQLHEWGVAELAADLQLVTDEIERRARGLGLTAPDGQRGPHMLGIEVPREVCKGLGKQLADRGVTAGIRGNFLRLAPHLHVTPTDIDRLIDALDAAL